ncbi:MAG: hypothetical protein V5A55_10725 [Halovenus sp.]
MTAETATDGALANAYDRRSNAPATDRQRRGNWVFIIGTLLSVVGFLPCTRPHEGLAG